MVATAEGGATAAATGTMVIEILCKGVPVESWREKSFVFDLPASGSVAEVFPASGSATEYISAPPDGEGCTRTFDYALSSGLFSGRLPDLDLSDDGVFTLTNRAADFVNNQIIVTVTDTDGENVVVEEFEFTISTVCGLESTVLVPPQNPPLNDLRKASVEDTQLIVSGVSFQSGNPNCPIIDYTIEPSDGTFILTKNLPDFSVALVENMHSSGSVTEGIFEYTITATAEGGKTMPTTAIMEVYNGCVSEQKADLVL